MLTSLQQLCYALNTTSIVRSRTFTHTPAWSDLSQWRQHCEVVQRQSLPRVEILTVLLARYVTSGRLPYALVCVTMCKVVIKTTPTYMALLL